VATSWENAGRVTLGPGVLIDFAAQEPMMSRDCVSGRVYPLKVINLRGYRKSDGIVAPVADRVHLWVGDGVLVYLGGWVCPANAVEKRNELDLQTRELM